MNKRFVHCDGNVDVTLEDNKELNTTKTTTWNGYAADEPLDNIASGRLNGGLIFTTGNGAYGRLGSGESRN